MNQSQRVFKEYLRRLGLLTPADLGPEQPPAAAPVLATENEWLASQLEQGARFNRQVVIVMIVLLCLLFGLGVALGFYLVKSPTFIGITLATLIVFLLRIISQLRKLWWDHSRMALVGLMMRESRPEDVVEIVKVLYWSPDKQSMRFDSPSGKKSSDAAQAQTNR